MWPARKRPPDERGIPIALQGNGTPNGYYNAASLPAGDQMRITVAPVFEHPSLGPGRRLVAKLHIRIEDRSIFWSPMRDSTHIWAAPLPRDLAPGVRRITIRAITEGGQVHRGTKLIEIAS